MPWATDYYRMSLSLLKPFSRIMMKVFLQSMFVELSSMVTNSMVCSGRPVVFLIWISDSAEEDFLGHLIVLSDPILYLPQDFKKVSF